MRLSYAFSGAMQIPTVTIKIAAPLIGTARLKTIKCVVGQLLAPYRVHMPRYLIVELLCLNAHQILETPHAFEQLALLALVPYFREDKQHYRHN